MGNQSATAVRTCRIIYYGARGSGKRENLQRISSSIPAESRLETAEVESPDQIVFRLPGSADAAWTVLIRIVDTGQESVLSDSHPDEIPFDGIVFVAHSVASRLDQCLSSLESLKAFLDSWGRDVTSVPLVIQYNKREQNNCLPVDRLESLLNPWGLLSYPASSGQGEGVKETLKSILGLSISNLVQDKDEARPVHGGGSGAGEDCPVNEAEKRVERQSSVSEPVFSVPNDPSELEIIADERGGLFYEDLRPPIVIPVRIPRRLLEKFNSARIILEVEIDDSKSMLS